MPHRFLRRTRLRRAFTLVELVVVVVVLAVLAAIAVVGYSRVIDRTEWASLEASARSVDSEYQALRVLDPSLTEAELGAILEASIAVASAGGVYASDSTLANDGSIKSIELDSFDFVPASERPESGTSAFELGRYGKTVCLEPTPTAGGSANITRSTCNEEPDWLSTADGADSAISVGFEELPGAEGYVAACWTAAMTAENPVTAAGTEAPIVVPGLQNFVTHTCHVTASFGPNARTSEQSQATPSAVVVPVDVGDPRLPRTPPGEPPVVVGEYTSECTACVPYEPPTTTTSPDTGGLWDITSMYSNHAGSHRLYAVDRGTGQFVSVVDRGTWATAAEAYTWRNNANTEEIVFSQPSGLAYGAHPARRPSSSVTAFSVLYLTEAGTGAVWMLDLPAHRATVVGTGFAAPTGVAWAACTNPVTGATATMNGASQCLFVADSNGVHQMPLLAAADANGSLQPVAAAAADSVQMSSAAALKVAASNVSLFSSETSSVVARPYTTTPGGSAPADAPAGSVFIPASVTGSTDLVVFADSGDHRIKSFNPATPSSVDVIAGSGIAGFSNAPGAGAAFSSPKAVHFHGNWPYVYVADTGNAQMRRLNVVTGELITILGPNNQTRIADNFDRANNADLGVTSSGSRPWIRAVGAASIAGNRMAFGSTGGTMVVESYTGDVTVTANPSWYTTIVARYTDDSNYLRVRTGQVGSFNPACYAYLEQVVAGVTTILAQPRLGTTGCSGQFGIPIGIRVVGTEAQVVFNDIPISAPVTVTIPASSTRHGLSGTSSSATFDNFDVNPMALDESQQEPPLIETWDTAGTTVSVTMTPLSAIHTIDTVGYQLLRDGTVIHTFPKDGPYAHSDTGRTPGQTYTYTLRVIDAYDHLSAESLPRDIDAADNPGTIVTLADDFDRANSTEVGYTSAGSVQWQKAAGVASIAGNRMAFGSSGGTMIVEAYTGDVTVTANPSWYTTIVARYTDDSNYLRVRTGQVGSFNPACYAYLEEVVAGVTTILAQPRLGTTGCSGQFGIPIGIRTEGSEAQVVFNGVPIAAPVTVTIPASSTRHGLSGTSTSATFDGFSLAPAVLDESQQEPPLIETWDTAGTTVSVTMTPLSPIHTIDTVGYQLLRDGTVIHTFPKDGPYTHDDTGRRAGQTYTYTLRVIDAYDHLSAESLPRSVDVADDPGTIIVVADDFDRANSTEVGYTSTGSVQWQKAAGVASIAGNTMTFGSSGGTMIVEAYTGDVTVTATPSWYSTVVARYTDDSNYLRVRTGQVGSFNPACYAYLEQVVAGVTTILAQPRLGTTGCSGQFGIPYGIRTVGNEAQVVFNGIPISAPVTVTIPASSTRHGLSGASSSATFDGFSLAPAVLDESQAAPPLIETWNTSGTTVSVTMTPLPPADTIDTVGYQLLRDGAVIHTFPKAGPYAHSDTGRTPGQTYTYTLRVIDDYSHLSAESPPRAIDVAASPGGSVAFSDNFDRANSTEVGYTSTGGRQWQKAVGVASIAGNTMTFGSSGGTTIVEAYTGNVTVTATPSWYSTVVARYTDSNNYLRVRTGQVGSFNPACYAYLEQVVGGVTTILSQPRLGTTGCSGQFGIPIGIQVVGTQAEVVFNGVSISTPVTVSIPSSSTRHGLSGSSASATFDNFAVVPS